MWIKILGSLKSKALALTKGKREIYSKNVHRFDFFFAERFDYFVLKALCFVVYYFSLAFKGSLKILKSLCGTSASSGINSRVLLQSPEVSGFTAFVNKLYEKIL